MADSNIDKKTWVVVTIIVAVIGCVGAVVAAAIGILPDIARPETTIASTTQVSTNESPLAQTSAPTHNPTAPSDFSDFSNWQVPSGHDGYVEYRRCLDYPDDNFPIFGADTPGYIHLIPQSARKENASYTWCVEVRSTGYNPDNLAVYFCAPPVSGFCAEPGKTLIPREAVVSVDNGSCVLSPVMGNRNGISIRNPRIIRITMPGDTTQEPTITVGPYSSDNASFIACP